MSIGLFAHNPDIFSNTPFDVIHAMVFAALFPVGDFITADRYQHGRNFTRTAGPGTGNTVCIIAQRLLQRPIELDLVLFG